MSRSVFPAKSTSLYTAQTTRIKTLESELNEMQTLLKAQGEQMSEMMKMIETMHRTRALDSLDSGHSLGDSCSPPNK